MKSAALLINLGSPKSTDIPDVKSYLDEFLMDPNVIDVPYVFRALLVKGIILNTRPKKSAAAYQSIWWDEGSPLMVISKRLTAKVASKTQHPVYLAMRYAEPSIASVMNQISAEHPDLTHLYVIPLYPHYAMSSYGTVKDRVEELANKEHPQWKISFKPAFYNEEAYIETLSNSIMEHLPSDHHLLFSYHGLPVRHLRKCDVTGNHCYKAQDCCNVPSSAHAFCYKHQTLETSRQVAQKLQLAPNQYSTSFQSRLGRDEWVKPYTAETLEQYPKQGIKKLAVVFPAFVSDCLETLEEINIEGRESFLHAGGESFISIPCLNDDDAWCELVAKWIDEALA